jgi:CBS-domain-containing membrane protein
MKVVDVMTKDPVTIGPETPLKDVADMLVARGISGLPIVESTGELVGVVSEADLLVKEKGAEPEARGGFGWHWLVSRAAGVEERAKLAARTAGEAMSAPAISIRPEQQVAEGARRMVENQVNRLPVVDEQGKVIGIVTRADLVRVFSRSDQEIEHEIEHDVVLRTLWIEPNRVKVRVARGEVSLTGRLDTKLTAELLPRLVERVPGVVSVSADLSWVADEQPMAKSEHHHLPLGRR